MTIEPMTPFDPSPLPPAIRTGSNGERLCSATSSRTGEPCRAAAIKGGNVCVAHGGRAPQVKAKAARRLLAAVDPAMARLVWLAEHSPDDRVRLRACQDILDRAGMAPPTRVELEAQLTPTGTLGPDLGPTILAALEETKRLAEQRRERALGGTVATGGRLTGDGRSTTRALPPGR